jgi:hypothetical protein
MQRADPLIDRKPEEDYNVGIPGILFGNPDTQKEDALWIT